MECVRNMIIAQGLGLELWGKAVNTVVYIKNRCPTKVLDSKTPQEAWSGRKPDVSHLRIFGCKTFAHVPDEKRTKLESKSKDSFDPHPMLHAKVAHVVLKSMCCLP
jgi:hypothetical protein